MGIDHAFKNSPEFMGFRCANRFLCYNLLIGKTGIFHITVKEINHVILCGFK